MLVKDMHKCTWYGKEITKAEYNEILSMLRNRPTAPEGYGYRLTADLVWELYELPPEEVTDEEATAEDYEAALGEMGVEV
jgi:hypothetical protein